MKCKRCNEELKGCNYYTKVNTLCKSCLVEEYMAELSVTKGNVEDAVHIICDRYNIVFKREVLENKWNKGLSLTAVFKHYMRDITSLPQYSRLDSNDSDLWNVKSGQFEKVYNKEENRTVVEFLENERLQLQLKLDKALNNDDASLYSKYIQAYERTLLLLQKESWQEKFSHYHSDGKELISTWEQKGEDIRNEKVYEVKVIKDIIPQTQQFSGLAIIDNNNPMTFFYTKEERFNIDEFRVNICIEDYSHYHTIIPSSNIGDNYNVYDDKFVLLHINNEKPIEISLANGGSVDVAKYINNGENTIKITCSGKYKISTSCMIKGNNEL